MDYSNYPMYPSQSVYNPYNDYYKAVQNQTAVIMPTYQPLPPSQQPTVIPPPVILANTYLPKTYYDDVIDNLELVSLNVINDLKALKKNQKHLKVNRFDPRFLTSLKSSIKEQFKEVEEFREKEKYKLTEEFRLAKNDIETFLREKFKPSQTIMENFRNELKKEKKVLTERLRDIEGTVKKENDEVETILLNSPDPVMKYAAERVYRPDEETELDFAIMLKKKYADKEDRSQLEKEIARNYPVEIAPLKEEKKKKEEVIVLTQDDGSVSAEEEEPEEEEEVEEKKEVDPAKKAEMRRRFRKIANVVIASRKMIVIRQLKLYKRVKDFPETLLSVEEYIDSMMENILFKPIETLEKVRSKLDITSKIQMNKVNEILKFFLNSLTDKTTKVQINRTFSFFFKRYVFNTDIVPIAFFSLFERRRIKYLKNVELNKEQQQFVLIMKVFLGRFVNETLLSKAQEGDEITSHNFKLIASIFYYSIIGFYREEMPLEEGEFDNSNAIFDENEQAGDFSQVELHFKEHVIGLDFLRKEERREVFEIQKQNEMNIKTYSPDKIENDIEEIAKAVFPYEYIRSYMESEGSFDLISALLALADKVISIMNSHYFGFRD